MFLSVALHITGDGLTVEAVPLPWLWNPTPSRGTVFFKGNGCFAAPILGRTGSWRDWVLSTPIALHMVIALGQTAPQIVPSLDELKVPVRAL